MTQWIQNLVHETAITSGNWDYSNDSFVPYKFSFYKFMPLLLVNIFVLAYINLPKLFLEWSLKFKIILQREAQI